MGGRFTPESVDGFARNTHPKRIFLTSGEFSLSIVLNLSYPTRFTYTFFEEIMKWACLKYLERCLPEASA